MMKTQDEKTPVLRFALTIGLALATAACASGGERVLFATNTSLAVDVDSAPPVLNVGYNRTEGIYGGVNGDGSSIPAVAHIRTDGGLFNLKAEQVYATGCASLLVQGNLSGIKGAEEVKKECALNSTGTVNTTAHKKKRMFFGTNTNFGLGMTFGASGVKGFHVGLKRQEVSVLPKTGTNDVRSIPSVVASLSIDTTGTAKAGTPNAEYGFVQFFGAGDAAIALAQNKTVRDTFDRKEALALMGVEKYDKNVADQQMQISFALSCYMRLNEANKVRARAAATYEGILTTTDPEKSDDSAYAQEVGDYDGMDENRVASLTRLRNFVCGLSREEDKEEETTKAKT